MLILTPFIWKDTIYLLCRIFAKVRDSILPLCLLALIVFHTLFTSLELSCTVCALHHIYAGYCLEVWDFTRNQKLCYMEIKSSKPCERFSFGLLIFTPNNYIRVSVSEVDTRFSFGLLDFARRQLYTGFGIRSWYKILLRAIGLHPEENTVIYGNDHTLILWNFIWPSVLIGPRRKNEHPNGQECTEASIPLRLGEEGSHRCVASKNTWKK